MGEIIVYVPDDMPLEGLKNKINVLIEEEQLRWSLFEKSADYLNLNNEDMEALETVREKVWQDKKAQFGL
jgi:hypothetical protein